MPKQERVKTDYKGVYYIMGKEIGTGKPERIYYITYRKSGRQIQEKAGRARKDNMTPAKASKIRVERMSATGLSNQEKRELEEARKKAEAGKWTIQKLWDEYAANRQGSKSLKTDEGRYNNYLKDVFGSKEPHEIAPLDVDRLRLKLSKKLSPQTVKHILNLFTWTVNYGVKKGLCKPLPFHVTKPTVDNQKTEDLTPDQLKSLMEALNKSENQQVANLMKLALFTGMRRGELFSLQWQDVDFARGFIHIREPKGGRAAQIPLNEAARELLQNHPKTKHKNSPYVFPGADGGRRRSVQKATNEIKKAAGLPADFRPLHGLRHVYASMLASSGRVDMYILQKLLTHKSPVMTQRYSHLRDEALKGAAGVVSDFYNDMARAAEKQKAENE